MLKNNALFLEKATEAEEYSPGEHRHWRCINTNWSHLKTPF